MWAVTLFNEIKQRKTSTQWAQIKRHFKQKKEEEKTTNKLNTQVLKIKKTTIDHIIVK